MRPTIMLEILIKSPGDGVELHKTLGDADFIFNRANLFLADDEGDMKRKLICENLPVMVLDEEVKGMRKAGRRVDRSVRQCLRLDSIALPEGLFREIESDR